MGTDEQGVIVKHLGARRLIVRVIQPHQGVPQKGSELAASFGDLAGSSLRFEYLRQIRPHLQYRVAIAVKSGGVFTPLASREERLWHLEFPQLSSKRYQEVGRALAIRDLIQAFPECEQRIERNEALIIQHQAHPVC